RRGLGRPARDVRLQRRGPARGGRGLPRRRRHGPRDRLAGPPARLRPRPRGPGEGGRMTSAVVLSKAWIFEDPDTGAVRLAKAAAASQQLPEDPFAYRDSGQAGLV